MLVTPQVQGHQWWHAIEEPEHSLFDLSSDPGELINLLDPSSKKAVEQLDILNRHKAANAAIRKSLGAGHLIDDIDDHTRHGLEALGYLE